ncbi:hypothetical protein H5410_043671 [Solanum commersonii]|uniref:Remorin C-terminal domain-containing protein n=1 Tax=Solanum commersonii TaxID=4109 RepID=A0A9J5XZ25_SOLCO|nr:hypothetical protein H5410_043671 [Solanum commersonii]
MVEEESSPLVSPQNYEHKNEEPNEKIEENNTLAIVPILDDKEKISSHVQERNRFWNSEKYRWLQGHRAIKKLSTVGSWENTKKASIEAELRLIQEELEKKKAEYAEKMKNKMAEIHREAEEKRAMIKAKEGEDILKVEEIAAKFRATGNMPKKFLRCFGY